MPIKFKCPHCQRGLRVADSLAGKRAPCPACKKALVIPAPAAAPADLEAFAASALGDEPLPADAAPRESTTIDLNCPFCDEPVHFATDLGGKQAPCPECRRIVKVPLPAKRDPKDWRKIENTGPSLARRDEGPAPEGAWDSAARPTAVSQEALEEAGAIREEPREPLTTGQRVRRGLLVAAGLLVVVAGWFALRSYWSRSLQDQAIVKALADVGGADGKEKVRLAPPAAAEVCRGLGEVHLHLEKLDDALKYFGRARAQVRNGDATLADRNLVLVELALSQIKLAGSRDEEKDKTRISWDEAARQWEQTLRIEIKDEAARFGAFRTVCRELIHRKQWSFATHLASLSESAKADTKPATKNKKKPRVVGLLLALHQPKDADRLLPPVRSKEEADLATRLVQSLEWRRQPVPAVALRFLQQAVKDPLPDRLQCLLTVAQAAYDQDRADDARLCVNEAAKLIDKNKKELAASSWLVMEWARLAQATEQSNQAEMLRAAISDPALRGWLALERYRAQVKERGELGDDSWSEAVPDRSILAHAVALEVFARHKAGRGGSEVMKMVDGVDPEAARALGYVGVALGVGDKK